MESLLVCIAYYNTLSDNYLKIIIERFKSYNMNIHIIVDTNSNINLNIDAEVFVYNLNHPYHLTWMHRKHFLDNINNYDWFMYMEDDMDVPFENFEMYMENFKLLWPNYIPSFVRVEKFNDKEFNSDNLSRQIPHIFKIKDKKFTTIGNAYHAFWIMSKNELKETMIDNFVRYEISRETAASYPTWELNKIPLLMMENNQISSLCYSYHLSNKYAASPDSPFGKIEMNNLLYDFNGKDSNIDNPLMITINR